MKDEPGRLRSSPSDPTTQRPDDLTTRPRGPHEFEVTRHEVPMPGLPAALDGVTFVQLSDFHRGCGDGDEVTEIAVGRANALEPDYVLLTGDFVNQHKRDVLPAVRLVAGLRARCGVYAVLGNHDHRADPVLLESALEAAGIPVLHNRAIEVEPGLWLAGIDDLTEGEPNLDAALAPVPCPAPCILLAHNPNTFDRVPHNRPLLVLSGHTHGGQIVLPFPTPAMVCRFHLGTRFVHGWYERGKARMYVNRGIGVTGGPLFARRYHCPSEVTLFRLRRGADE